MPGGRPSKYSLEVAAEVCARIAAGETLISICKEDHLPSVTTINTWALYPSEEASTFPAAFTRARLLQREAWAEMAAEEAMSSNPATKTIDTTGGRFGNTSQEIVYDNVERSKVKINTLMWFLARLDRVKYGDKVDGNSAVKDGAIEIRVINDPEAD